MVVDGCRGSSKGQAQAIEHREERVFNEQRFKSSKGIEL